MEQGEYKENMEDRHAHEGFGTTQIDITNSQQYFQFGSVTSTTHKFARVVTT
jgi:hypothetical protein